MHTSPLDQARDRIRLWHSQREQCEVCVHVRIDGPAMYCRAGSEWRAGCYIYCIDARNAEGPCGDPPRFFIKEIK